MNTITTTSDLAAFCNRLKGTEFITVDTEFMRESTFWPQLCLIQVAGPDDDAAIDPLAEDIDLAPLFDLLNDESILKVFHAGRQDIEIFYHLTGKVPHPVFDTQIAAMVCGFGDSVGYETLVSKIARTQIDKSSRFTDWSRRPLTDRQLAYALADVTHLRVVFEKMMLRLKGSERLEWLNEEMNILTSPETYQLHPENAWKRVKTRNNKPRFLAILKECAAWREEQAQGRDMPRNRILRDEALLEIAAHPPRGKSDLARVRGVGKGFVEGRMGSGLLEAVKRGQEIPDADCPAVEKRESLPRGLGPLVDLLKVLLKMQCEEHDVAQKLVCNTPELELLAADDNADIPALSGWRREMFGNAALALKHGRLALAAEGSRMKLIELPRD